MSSLTTLGEHHTTLKRAIRAHSSKKRYAIDNNKSTIKQKEACITMSTYICYSIYIYVKKRPLLQPQPSINHNTAHPRLRTGGWTVGGEFGSAAVALLLLSSVSKARFESTALLPLSLVARHGVYGSQRQCSSPPHWRRGHGAPPPLLGGATRRRRSSS